VRNVLGGVESWAHNEPDRRHTVADPLNPVEPPVIVPPTAKEKIVFACDYSGLLISTGATLQAPATIAANGSMARLRAVFSSQPVEAFLVRKDFSVSPRSPNADTASISYRERMASGINGNNSSGAHISLLHYTPILSGATISGARTAALVLDGEEAGAEAIHASIYAWRDAMEASPLLAANHWTVGIRSLLRFDYGAGVVDAMAAGFFYKPALGFGFEAEIWPAIYGGSWTASFGGHTATIHYNASATQIRALLNALPSVAANGGVSVDLLRADHANRAYWDASYEAYATAGGIARPGYSQPATYQHQLKITQQ
jgi:hypothetical protein